MERTKTDHIESCECRQALLKLEAEFAAYKKQTVPDNLVEYWKNKSDLYGNNWLDETQEHNKTKEECNKLEAALAAIQPQLAQGHEPIAYLKDLDGTGSLHPCAKNDEGCIPVYIKLHHQVTRLPENHIVEPTNMVTGLLSEDEAVEIMCATHLSDTIPEMTFEQSMRVIYRALQAAMNKGESK